MTDFDEQRVMAQMGPGVCCRDGFLGEDTRSLGEIIAADAAELSSLGVTSCEIAASLSAILELAQEAQERPVELSPGARAQYTGAMGQIPSPFGDGLLEKGQVELSFDDETVVFTPLLIHMIGEYGFFEGLGGRYRRSPREWAKLLGFVE
ncbi:MAG: hypothetical protein HN909_03255 [Phycisphaerales bacterium]|jgi:hypothetical protein|nr:hypothetical protein [Phycisphaerales bacterium]MBT7170769.1 hypothetical protein [Phycisphaerales bacterium]